MTDQPALRPRAERCPDPTCTDEQQCWRCDAEESQHAGQRGADFERTAGRLQRRLDAARAWARQHLTPELETGLLGVLRGDDPNAKCRRCHCPSGSPQCEHCNCCDVPDQRADEPRTVLDAPPGQPAIDRILADADHHDECARLSKTDEGAISHSSIAGGLRIAVQHVRRGHDAEVAMLRQRLQLATTGLDDDKISLRKADVDLANAERSRDGWRRDYAALAETYKAVYARADRAEAEREQLRGQVERVRKTVADRRAEVDDYEAEQPPSAWSDAVTVTCNRIDDALRVFPPPQGIHVDAVEPPKGTPDA